jgi:Tol biopolymer transport system component
VDRYRLSASSTDTIAFRPITMRTDLVWFDRKGNEIGRIDSDGELVDPDVAPDGRRVVANRGPDIWLFDAGRGVPDRLTSGGGIYPVFSSGGRRVAFLKVGQGTLDLYVQDAVRGAPEERVLSTPSLKSPTALSRDGHLLFQETSAETGGDVWVLSLDGERKPVPVANSRSAEGAGQFSPDGTWVTYHSNETGRMEVYAQPFPGGPSARVPVSRGGGREARWGDDGREIFYLAPDDRLMTVSVVPGRDKSLEFGPPKPLFPTRIPEAQGGQRLQYDVADRGQKFLIRTIRDDPPEPITLILNWKPQR